MSVHVDKIIEDISQLSAVDKDEVLLALVAQKQLEAQEVEQTTSDTQRSQIEEELVSRLESADYIDISTEADRQAMQREVRRRVNERLGGNLLDDA